MKWRKTAPSCGTSACAGCRPVDRRLSSPHQLTNPELVQYPDKHLVQANRYLIRHEADVPVLLSAMATKPDWLLTHNTKHFTKAVARRTSLRINSGRILSHAFGFVAVAMLVFFSARQGETRLAASLREYTLFDDHLVVLSFPAGCFFPEERERDLIAGGKRFPSVNRRAGDSSHCRWNRCRARFASYQSSSALWLRPLTKFAASSRAAGCASCC